MRKNYVKCPSKDGLAESLHIGFTNELTPWAHFLPAGLGNLGQLPPSLLSPACVCCCLFIWQEKSGFRGKICSKRNIA